MSLDARKILANVSVFVMLLISWWTVGSFVSQTAVQEDGKFFDAFSPILPGSYFNDWLPVFAAGAFGIGWLIGVLIPSVFRSNFHILMAAIVLIAIPIVLGIPMQIRINSLDYPLIKKLFETILLLFMFGSTHGLGVGQFRKLGTSANV